MITHHPADSRGHTRLRWLDSRHSFSFGDYYDPQNLQFRSLRVINDDRIAAGAGFPTHGHSDAEILTYVLEGAIEHRDSLGNGSVIRPGEIQRMSAGHGVRHSEFNASQTAEARLLQIWLLPRSRGITPSYEQKPIAAVTDEGTLHRIAAGVDVGDSDDGPSRGDAVTIHADADLYAAILPPGSAVDHRLRRGGYAWIQIARGEVELEVGDQRLTLAEGDGAALHDTTHLRLHGRSRAELLLFDLG